MSESLEVVLREAQITIVECMSYIMRDSILTPESRNIIMEEKRIELGRVTSQLNRLKEANALIKRCDFCSTILVPYISGGGGDNWGSYKWCPACDQETSWSLDKGQKPVFAKPEEK
ncbi:MAG: hypothetical protein GQ570_03735 [Helicobacteraceae bacterium]|nr:hypothetical protein [Helicobacteraceae bacterium]